MKVYYACPAPDDSSNTTAIADINADADSQVYGSFQLNGLLQRFQVFTQLPKRPSVVFQYSFSFMVSFVPLSSHLPLLSLLPQLQSHLPHQS